MRWWLAALAVPVVGIALFAAWVYLDSEATLHHRYPLPASPGLPAPAPDAATRGAHLAAVYGCADCHGADLRGRPFPHPDPFRKVMSANLTLKAKTYSDLDLARAIRRGLTRTGESVEYMPSSAFVHMSDEDVVAIIAHIRALPAGGQEVPAWTLSWKSRWQLATGKFPPGLTFVADAMRLNPRDLGPATAGGRQLAAVACAECHGGDLRGQPGPPGGPPDLAVVGAYDPADFRRLMKTGVAAGGRELPMMSPTARGRFSHFSDEEIEAIRLYLVARAQAGA